MPGQQEPKNHEGEKDRQSTTNKKLGSTCLLNELVPDGLQVLLVVRVVLEQAAHSVDAL